MNRVHLKRQAFRHLSADLERFGSVLVKLSNPFPGCLQEALNHFEIEFGSIAALGLCEVVRMHRLWLASRRHSLGHDDVFTVKNITEGVNELHLRFTLRSRI